MLSSSPGQNAQVGHWVAAQQVVGWAWLGAARYFACLGCWFVVEAVLCRTCTPKESSKWNLCEGTGVDGMICGMCQGACFVSWQGASVPFPTRLNLINLTRGVPCALLDPDAWSTAVNCRARLPSAAAMLIFTSALLAANRKHQ
jgi:hypothetical protein